MSDGAESAGAAAVGGLHEACFGVPDLEAAAAYWAAFGFRPGPAGELERREARRLYGVDAGLRSLRLLHLDADHGLVRLMQWDEFTGPGIGAAGLRLHGGRWVAQFVRSTLEVANHAELARRSGAELVLQGPEFIDLSMLYGASPVAPFAGPVRALRELTLIQPLWRQALLERFGYDSAMLGRIDDDALLRASQVSNASFMIRSDDPAVFDFYAGTLGLRGAPVQDITWERAMASRKAFELREGERHWCHVFDEPRSGGTPETSRSGRLYLFRFPSESVLPDGLEHSQPGRPGLTLFTWRVRDLPGFRRACEAAGCGRVTPVIPDEFGVEAFSCVTPDGMTWTFQQASMREVAEMSP